MIRVFFVHIVTCRTNGFVGIVAVSLVKQWSIDHSQSNSRAIKCIIERCGTNINGTRSSFVVPRPRRGESVQNWARRRVWRYVIFPSKELLSQPKVIFSPSQRNRVRISVTENGSVAASRTAVSSRDDRPFHCDYYFAPLPHGSTIGRAIYLRL